MTILGTPSKLLSAEWFDLTQRVTSGDVWGRLGRVGPYAVVGGWVRDTLAGKTWKDVDILVDGFAERLEEELRGLYTGRTATGGFEFSTDGVEFDVWAWETSFVVARGVVPEGAAWLDYYPKSVLLSTDGGMWVPGEGRAVVDDLVKTLETGVVTLVCGGNNPNPKKSLAKLGMLNSKLGLEPKPGLREYLESMLASSGGQ